MNQSPMLQPLSIKYLSISELNRSLNSVLERELPEVFFTGEISEISRPASGHIYYTVKDEKSQISAVMWRGMASALTFKPEPGVSVNCHGKPNVYHVSGKLQIVVHTMTVAGEGLLQRKFLELKAKLEREGLFALERKRKLPFLPTAVGIVTSGSGAVIHDIMVRIGERMPFLKTYLINVRVQGDGASAEIASAIEYFNELKNVDVIIVARGGGSLEDLWAFNEERTVRAIFASRIPVVSGVGHEVDVTLSDLVSDVRAPTPTAAAEIVVPKREDLLNSVEQLLRRLSDYQRWYAPLVQQVDELTLRLEAGITNHIERVRMSLKASEAKVKLLEPTKLLSLFLGRVQLLADRMQAVSSARISKLGFRVESLRMKLEAISPRKVLERGFSIVHSAGRVITRAAQVRADETLNITLAEGQIVSKVKEIIP